jgi:hypothetical protein
MTRYLQFTAADGSPILVEVDEREDSPREGIQQAGVRDRFEVVLVQAQASFEDVMKTAIRQNVQAFVDAIHGLERRPSSVEISFGLKAAGEVGNLAIGKMGADVNYTVKLAWNFDGNADQ